MIRLIVAVTVKLAFTFHDTEYVIKKALLTPGIVKIQLCVFSVTPVKEKVLYFVGGFVFVYTIFSALADIQFERRWLLFFLWLFSIFVCLIPSIISSVSSRKRTINLPGFFKKYWIFFLVLSLGVFTRLFLLEQYPFVSIGDAVRDGGLDARSIFNGELAYIFAYGRYQAHGLLIPTFVVPFYAVFRDSVMSFRSAAACISLMDIVAVFLLLKKAYGKNTALFGMFIVTSMTLHMYYARSEVVVIFSSLFTTLIFYFLYNFICDSSHKNLVVLSLVLGIALNLHASVRNVVLITLPVVLVILFRKYRSDFTTFFNHCFQVLLFVLIGFGPRLLFTSPQIFFHVKRLEFFNAEVSQPFTVESLVQMFQHALINYPTSLFVYIYTNTSLHYRDPQSLLPVVFSIFFIVGILYAIKGKNKFTKILLLFVFLLPLTNSAITDDINADHRLAPLYPLAALFSALGISVAWNFFSQRTKKYPYSNVLIIVCVALSGLVNIFNFYYYEKANISMFRLDLPELYQDFMLTQSIQNIKSDTKYYSARFLCVGGSQKTVEYLKQLHIQEQFDFFLPRSTVFYATSTSVDDTTLLLSSNCLYNRDITWKKTAYCERYEKFVCPMDGQKFSIWMEEF